MLYEIIGGAKILMWMFGFFAVLIAVAVIIDA